MRLILLFCLGGLIGAIFTATLGNIMRQHNVYPRGLMNVMQHTLRTARDSAQNGQCASVAHSHALIQLENLSSDIEPALFASGTQDPVFHRYAQTLRDEIAKVTAAGNNCSKQIVALADVANACEACHRDYR